MKERPFVGGSRRPYNGEKYRYAKGAPDMELRQLEYFAAVCKEMHFSRAAEQLCTTQSNLSQQIKFLENELGLPLFDRIGKRIALTEAGRILLEQCHLVFERLDYARGAIADLKRMEGGRLDIGILPGDGDLLFDALLVDFHRTYPKISIRVTETMDVYEQVLDGTRDLGVTTAPSKPDDRIAVIPLFHEEFALAIRAIIRSRSRRRSPSSSCGSLSWSCSAPSIR